MRDTGIPVLIRGRMTEAKKPAAPASKARIFALRTTSTLGLWALVTCVFVSGNAWAFCGFISLMAALSLAEFFNMVRKSGSRSFPVLTITTGLLYCVAFTFFHAQGATPPAALDAGALFVIAGGGFTLLLRHEVSGKDTLHSLALALLGFIYIPFLFLFTIRIIFIDPAPAAGVMPESGPFLLLWLLAVTKFTDMGAYISGSAIGKHKMIPHISPAKTWEGFAGALIFAQVAACGLFAIFPRQLAPLGAWHHVIALGFILALLAVIGDLAESVVKRSLGAKDSGRFLPGIGGALDLIDSVCFTAPAMYFYLQWIRGA